MKQIAILISEIVKDLGKNSYLTMTDISQLNNYLANGWKVISCTARYIDGTGIKNVQGDILVILENEGA